MYVAADKWVAIDYLLDILYTLVNSGTLVPINEVWSTSAHIRRLSLPKLLDDLRELALASLGFYYGRGWIRACSTQQAVLCTQVAEVAILKLIVLVTVHVGKDLQDDVLLEAQLHRVDHVGKVREVDHSFGTDVERAVRCRYLAELFDYALGKEGQLCLEFQFIVLCHGLFCCEERIIPASSIILCPNFIISDQGSQRCPR